MNKMRPFIPNEPARKGSAIKACGIDLGTSNSSISVASVMPHNLSKPSITPIEIEQQTPDGVHHGTVVPSVVAIKDGCTYVGQGAKLLRAEVGNHESGLKAMVDVFWDCKNYMGRDRGFLHAPFGFQTPESIAGHIIRYLALYGIEEGDDKVRTVVTVPASYGSNQREATLDACLEGELELKPEELLDEPLAAFLGYLHEKGLAEFQNAGPLPCNLLVLDFGGGTCDIAVFKVGLDCLGCMTASPLGVSRYQRLGGSDIDQAIVHEVLIPALYEQNGLAPLDLTYEDKKKRIEPALINVAESMKIAMCEMIGREQHGEAAWGNDGPHACFQEMYEFVIGDGRVLKLRVPPLSKGRFNELLDPFFDRDLLYPQTGEFRLTCSVFAPITDVLERTGLSAEDIRHVLLAGGSSRIPRTRTALSSFFHKAKIHTFAHERDELTAVSRGAALQALSLQVYGRGLIQPASGGAVCIKTNSGPVELVKRNAVLPFPGKGEWASLNDLSVPETSLFDPLTMRVHFVNDFGDDLGIKAWDIEPPAVKGQPLCLKYRMDGNQIFEAELSVLDADGQRTVRCEVVNTHVHVCDPGEIHDEIEDLEGSSRRFYESSEYLMNTLRRLIVLYEKVGHREKAIDACRRVLRWTGGKDHDAMNRMGLLYGECGNTDREVEILDKAAKLGNESAMFNLALRYRSRKLYAEAIQTLDMAVRERDSGPHLALRAVIARDMGDAESRLNYTARAVSAFGHVESLCDWELHWFRNLAEMADDKELVERVRVERKRRDAPPSNKVSGILPDYSGVPARTVRNARFGQTEG